MNTKPAKLLQVGDKINRMGNPAIVTAVRESVHPHAKIPVITITHASFLDQTKTASLSFAPEHLVELLP